MEKWKPGVLMFWGAAWVRKSPTVLLPPAPSKSFIQAVLLLQLKPPPCEMYWPFFPNSYSPLLRPAPNRSVLVAEDALPLTPPSTWNTLHPSQLGQLMPDSGPGGALPPTPSTPLWVPTASFAYFCNHHCIIYRVFPPEAAECLAYSNV